MTAVDKNEDLITFDGKTEDRSVLVQSKESYLEAMTFKNDKFLTSAQGVPFEFQEPRFFILSRVSSLMASSKTSSQCKHNYVIAKVKCEEVEKQKEAAILLTKQKKLIELDELG